MPQAGYPMQGGFDAAGTVERGMKRAAIMTAVIMVLVAVPLLAVFVDWSIFSSDGPEGGFCQATVRCCIAAGGKESDCENFADLPGAGCERAYESYKEAAERMGEDCE